jgi:hypothetical protein
MNKLSFRVPPEIAQALHDLGKRRKMTLTELAIEAFDRQLRDWGANHYTLPSLEERRAANRERLRRTALARWHPKENQ